MRDRKKHSKCFLIVTRWIYAAHIQVPQIESAGEFFICHHPGVAFGEASQNSLGERVIGNFMLDQQRFTLHVSVANFSCAYICVLGKVVLVALCFFL